MKIAELVELERIAYREIPVPNPGPGEILVKTRAVGLCGTDVKAYFRGHPYFSPPCVLGHEFAGTVAALGEGVERFKVGDRIVAAPYVECGDCELCKRGLGELCTNKAFIDGAFKEFILLPRSIVERATFRLATETDFATGSLAEPLACAYNGIEKAGINPGDRVLVIGAGPMGVMLALLAKSQEANVIVSEISPERLAAARQLELDVIFPYDNGLAEQLKERWGKADADRVLVAVGNRAVFEDGFNFAAAGGRVLLFGGLPKGEKVCVDAFKVHYREISLVGSFGFNLRQFQQAVSWLNDNSSLAKRVVTHTVPFSELTRAFELARDAKELKIIVDFGELEEDQ